MRKTVLTIYLALILIPALAFGYQFEDYVWGTPKAKIKKQLGLKNEAVTEEVIEGCDVLQYSDRIFDKECRVQFGFTPKAKLLFQISIGWDGDVCDNMRKRMVDKYGEPQEDFLGTYIWGDPFEKQEDSMMLRYHKANSRTGLYYYSGKYFKQYEQEYKPFQ